MPFGRESLLPARPAGQALQFFPGHYLDVLFSSFHGLFSWTPIALLAVAGFIFVSDRRLKLAFVYAFVVEVIIGGAAPDWFGGFSFGARRFGAGWTKDLARIQKWLAGDERGRRSALG